MKLPERRLKNVCRSRDNEQNHKDIAIHLLRPEFTHTLTKYPVSGLEVYLMTSINIDSASQFSLCTERYFFFNYWVNNNQVRVNIPVLEGHDM